MTASVRNQTSVTCYYRGTYGPSSSFRDSNGAVLQSGSMHTDHPSDDLRSLAPGQDLTHTDLWFPRACTAGSTTDCAAPGQHTASVRWSFYGVEVEASTAFTLAP